MTILRLKNSTNIYRIDAKKLEGERGYLALEDLRIKSKFSRSNMPIREVGRSGESKNLRGRRKKRKKPRPGRWGDELKHHLDAGVIGAKPDAIDLGVKLGANDSGAEVPRLRRRRRGRGSSAPITVASRRVISASITTAPSRGSRF